MKIVTVVGARPQFIKAAAVTSALRAKRNVREVLVHTGQHYDDSMSKIFFEQLGLPEPDFNLGIGSASHGAQTGRMLEAVETVLLAEKPDWVLVYGDTNSTLAGALAAAKLCLPLAHVEAGLRSYQRAMPEEINRVLTDRVSDLLFAPTDSAVRNLHKEGIADDKIRLVGDVMFDAALQFVGRADAASLLQAYGLQGKRFALVTLHRAENTDDAARLSSIVGALCAAGNSIALLFPMHPRTRDALDRNGLLARLRDAVTCIEPLGYFDMLALEKSAAAVVTDSGGVQKEAFFFGTPCLILRPRTEWVELVELGCARLCEPADLPAAIRDLPEPQSAKAQSLFGGGKAAQRIVDALLA
jgi:UDP-GlcNAc3NAcA epimerase